MELQMSENINELAKALAAAQGVMTAAKKECANPFYKSKYADLAACWDVCREPLAKNGLSIIQIPSQYAEGKEMKIKLLTMLCHSSGQYIKGEIEIPIAKPDAQGIGSAITYGRRYSLCAMVGIAQDDDDGNGACGLDQQKQDAPQQQRQQQRQQQKPQQRQAPAKQEVEKQPEEVTSVHNDGNVRYVNGATCQVRNNKGQYIEVDHLTDEALKALLGMDSYSAAHGAIKAAIESRSVER